MYRRAGAGESVAAVAGDSRGRCDLCGTDGMKSLTEHAKRVFRVTSAVILILIAAFLGFVPMIPGWPLALAGLSILAVDFVWAARLKAKLREKTTKVVNKVRRKET